MKKSTSSKFLLIFSILIILLPFLPATLANETISRHIHAEGIDWWDHSYNTFIKVKYEYDPTLVQPTPSDPLPIVGSLEKGVFKKYTVDPTTGEENVLFLGILKDGIVVYLGDDWLDPPTGDIHHYGWYFIGEGEVKTPTTTYYPATIEFIFFVSAGGQDLLFARFNYGDIRGPFGTVFPERPGTVTSITKY